MWQGRRGEEGSGSEGVEDGLLEGGKRGEGAGAVACVAAGDIVELIEGFGNGAEMESGRDFGDGAV